MNITKIISFSFAFSLLAQISHAAGNSVSSALSKGELLKCQNIIEDIKWENRIWPSTNPPKPLRHEIIKNQSIEEKIIDSNKMQLALKREFGYEINAEILQQELNRVAANTKNHSQLQIIFDELENDPNVIAECLIKPQLVEKLLKNRFSKSKSIHLNELNKFNNSIYEKWSDNKIKNEGVSIYQISYIRGKNPKPFDEINPYLIYLDEEKFNTKLNTLTQNSNIKINAFEKVEEEYKGLINETNTHYTSQNIVDFNDKLIQVRVVSWPKISFKKWWDNNKINWQEYQINISKTNLNLPSIEKTNIELMGSINKGMDADFWINKGQAPEARQRHSTIWTGSEMIIWGGFNQDMSIVFDDGAIYDPTIDSWDTISSDLNSASARALHSAVWTGTEMIIWGGVTSTIGFLNSGASYNPTTNVWSSIPDSNISGRIQNAAVWSGSEMLIWGGYNSNFTSTNIGEKYSPISGWSSIEIIGAPSPRLESTAIFTGTEMIIWGGHADLSSVGLNSGGKYNPATNTWTPTSTANNVPAGVSGHSAIWTGQEMIVWGGTSQSIASSEGAVYHPNTDQWVSINASLLNTPSPRHGHHSVWTGTELIIWSGINQLSIINDGAIYNPNTQMWNSIDLINSPVGTIYNKAIWSGSEMIVWGGADAIDIDSLATSITNQGGRFNPNDNTWKQTSLDYLENPPEVRFANSTTWTGNEFVIWGGSNSTPLNTGGIYYPVLDSWVATDVATAPSARYYHTAIWTGTEVLYWGGTNISSVFNSGASFIPFFNTFNAISSSGSLPTARYYHTAVWTGDEMIVWGGRNASTNFESGGKYNPTSSTWTATTLTNAPIRRRQHSAVWDGTEMIIWGGLQGTTLFNDLGRYNPISNEWEITGTPTGTLPESRYLHSTVWTGTEMIVWGGYNITQSLNSGSIYNPISNSWTATSLHNAPSNRMNHSAVWTGSEMIVWGGDNGTNETNTGSRYNVSLGTWSDTNLNNAPYARSLHGASWAGDKMLVWGGGNEGGNKISIYNPNLEKFSLGDFVWYDGNQNGIQDVMEQGLGMLSLNLYANSNCSGAAVDSVQTGTNGSYVFNDLIPQTYCIEMPNLASTTEISPINQGNNDSLDSDSDLNGRIQNIEVNSNTNDYDIGLFVSGSIGDMVWCDGISGSNDGMYSAGEELENIRIDLYEDLDCNGTADGNFIDSKSTNNSGGYLFTGLPVLINSDTCYVTQIDLNDNDLGLCHVLKSGPASQQAQINPITMDDLTHDYYFVRELTIGNFVWHDVNENGIQDSNEPGINGIDVDLYSNSSCTGSVLATTTTSTNTTRIAGTMEGVYNFDGLDSGDYCLEFNGFMSGFIITEPHQGGDTDIDSDANISTRQIQNINLINNDESFDLGIYKHGSLSGATWCESSTNQNQTYDISDGDLPIPQIEVSLIEDSNCSEAIDVNEQIVNINTDSNGLYGFNDLSIGTINQPVCYIVQVDILDEDLNGCPNSFTDTLYTQSLNLTQSDVTNLDFGFNDIIFKDGFEE